MNLTYDKNFYHDTPQKLMAELGRILDSCDSEQMKELRALRAYGLRLKTDNPPYAGWIQGFIDTIDASMPGTVEKAIPQKKKPKRDYTDATKYLIVDGRDAIPKDYMQLSTRSAIYLLTRKVTRKSFLDAFHDGNHAYYLMPVYKAKMKPISNLFLLNTGNDFYKKNPDKIEILMNRGR